MKIIFYTSAGDTTETALSYKGKKLIDPQAQAFPIVNNECNPNLTKDSQGVIVYMSRQEFDELNARSPSSGLEGKSEPDFHPEFRS